MFGSDLFIEFPRDKYRYAQEALALRKHLKNKNDEDAKMDLCCVEGKIRVCVDYHKMNDATENRIVHKIYHVSLDKEEQESWMKFRELAESITALEGIHYPIREEDLTTVKKDDNLAGFIGEYVVMPLTSPVGWYGYIPPAALLCLTAEDIGLFKAERMRCTKDARKLINMEAVDGLENNGANLEVITNAHTSHLSERLFVLHLARIDRILQSVPSPGAGH
ncbi:hypothetical protein Tco_0936580 [Tanacetum coccineum]